MHIVFLWMEVVQMFLLFPDGIIFENGGDKMCLEKLLKRYNEKFGEVKKRFNSNV